MSSFSGVRLIALVEAAKGALVLLAGLGVLGLWHGDAQRMAEELVRHSHLNPASRYPRIFLEAARNANDSPLRFLACSALAYAALRLAEAYGLWHHRRWAVWLGVVTGGIY